MILNCFLLNYLTSAFRRTKLTKRNVENWQEFPLVKDIEDIEAISYFMLLHNNYFKRNPLSSSVVGETTEKQLVRFFDGFLKNIVDGTSMTASDSETLNCSAQVNVYLNQYNSTIASNKLNKLCEAATTCQSTGALIDLIKSDQNDSHDFVAQSIVKLCPIILFQLHDDKCPQPVLSNGIPKPPASSVWGFSFLFVTIISFCSLVGVALFPFIGKLYFEMMFNLFGGLAVGSLIGSAIFQLIPQAFDLYIEDSPDHLWKAMIIFGGIYLFFWSERLMKLYSEYKRKQRNQDINVPSDVINGDEVREINRQVYFRSQSERNVNQIEMLDDIGSKKRDSVDCDNLTTPGESAHDVNVAPSCNRSRSTSFNKHSHFIEPQGNNEPTIKTVAWMIIIGDGLHNFIDGLSLGAAFSNSILSGISISVAIICEEFPHELGDFAVLINSGMSVRQAIGFNFLSACTCYIGMAFGILLGNFTGATTYILALAGGMFLYIALVDMMAELSAALDEALSKSMSTMIKLMVLQDIGILTGISLLFTLAMYSRHINFEGLEPYQDSPGTPIFA